MPTPIKAVRYAPLSAKQIKTILVKLPAYLEMMDETDAQAAYMKANPDLAEAVKQW
jgi:hypothetical protein